MSDTPSAYARTHNLAAKYAVGVIFMVTVGLIGLLNGDSGSLITLKIFAAIPIAIAWICLLQIFNPERSRTPFTPSFIERTALEGTLLSVAITLASWSPEDIPAQTVVTVVFGLAVYFGAISAYYRFGRRR